MSIFDDLPEFDFTTQDRYLDFLIMLEDFEEVDIEENFPILTIQYGWSSYEEHECITTVINVDTFEITEFSDGHSCFGGSYEDRNDTRYETFPMLISTITAELMEYYPQEECSLN